MYAQYMKDFGKAHHFDIMAGYEWQHFHKETDYYYYGTYPDTNLEHAGEIYNPSENTLYKTENYLVSFFGRMNYSLLDRYLLTFTLRVMMALPVSPKRTVGDCSRPLHWHGR